jgi:very long chain acyl-CoA dehydrogenase
LFSRLFVALTGIQYAGSNLKELQQAFKNPTANLGLIFKEASKRASSYIGLGGVDMTNLVAPSLKDSAKLCGDNIDEFSKAIESLLIKHGKNIVNEQFLLNRLADSAIDIYAMACVLSRATRSISLNLPSAENEKLMAETWCVEANDRVKINLRKTHSSEFSENYKRMSIISKNVCLQHDVVQNNPLGV